MRLEASGKEMYLKSTINRQISLDFNYAKPCFDLSITTWQDFVIHILTLNRKTDKDWKNNKYWQTDNNLETDRQIVRENRQR